jgi:hypothetical protein
LTAPSLVDEHTMKAARLLLWPRLWSFFAFVLGVLPLGLSSMEMWDGVVGMHALAQNDWLTLKGWLLNSNWYLTYGLFLLADALQQLAGLPCWIFFKLWILLMIVGIAFEVNKLAKQVFELPEAVAAWLAALVFSFPLWYVFFSFTPMLGHLTCAWLALIGYRFLYSNKLLLKTIGLVFVTLSFQLASNCAFILALEIGRWAISRNKAEWPYARSVLLLALSLAVFAATRVIWPPIGTYVGYNHFLNPLQISSWVSYAKYSAFFATWLLLLVPMAVGAWWVSRRHRQAASVIAQSGQQDWKKLAFCVFVGLSACAPYIAVGLGSPLFTVSVASSSSVSAVLASHSATLPVSVWYGGWGARHVLLMMVTLIILAGCLAVRSQKAAGSALFRLQPAWAFAATVCLNLAMAVPGHWAKLQRLAKEHSVVTALASKPRLPYGLADLLLDKHVDYLSSIYETNYLLYRAYGQTRWAAVMLPENAAIQAWGEEHRKLTLDQPEKSRAIVARLNLMNDYSWADSCKTVARITLPELSAWDVLWRAEHALEQLPKAQILPVSSTCPDAGFWR